MASRKAQYKGTGTVNGAGAYPFLLTAGDGCTKTEPDTFRIKIWDDAGRHLRPKRGSSDDIDNANPQAIGGGSIVIHRN